MLPPVLIELPVLLTPVLLAGTWWIRLSRKGMDASSSWRTHALSVGLVAATLNAILFYLWFGYTRTSFYNGISNVHYYLGNFVGLPLICIPLGSSILGEGRARAMVAASAVLGFLVWIQVGTL